MDHTPKYLYHGSQYYLNILIPQQARGQCERESMYAIYAAETLEEVIPFALPIRWYPDTPEGKRVFRCKGETTLLDYGSLNPEGVGYVYKVKADTFTKIDEWQWITKENCTPIEIIEIKVKDYLHTIEFSQKAKEINYKLYGI